MRPIFLGLTLAVLPLPATAEDPITVIVSRGAESVEFYLSISPADAPGWLGGGLDALAPDGVVPMDVVRRDGTAAAADAMIASTTLAVGGAPVELQAMSVMVHPEGTPLPFETPIDAQMAMSVCTAPDLVAGSMLGDLRAYAGYHAYPVDGTSTLEWRPGGNEARAVSLHVWEAGKLILSEDRILGPGAPLSLAASAPARSWLWPVVAALVVGAVGAAALLRIGRRAESAA
jgi:hypothetical protein